MSKQPIKIWRRDDAPEQYRQAEPETMWNRARWIAEVPKYLREQFPLLLDAWLDIHHGNGFSSDSCVAVEYDDEITLIFGDG